MTAVEIGLDEIEEFGAGDDWAERIVEAMAFRHVGVSSSCTGYCMAGSGRTTCGMCGWSLSGRMDDVGELRSGRFALAALATIGAAVTSATIARVTPQVLDSLTPEEDRALRLRLGIE